MTKHIKAKSLKFLSLDGLYKALVGEKRNDCLSLNLVIIISQVIIQLNHLIN